MKPGDLRRFRDNDQTRAYDKPGYVRTAGMVFMVTEAEDAEPPCWVSFLINGNLEEHWVYDFVLGLSEPINETR